MKFLLWWRERWPLSLGLLAFAAWLSWLVLALSTDSPAWVPEFLRLRAGDTMQTRGQFGDAFGPFNALVSALALIGLLFTLRTQQDQIRQQERTSASNDLLVRQQQFQEQYHRAIDTYRSLLGDVTAQSSVAGGTPVFGRAALQTIWREQFIREIDTTGVHQLGAALAAQLKAYENESLGAWNTHQNAAANLGDLLQGMRRDPALQDACLARIGAAWNSAYLTNRFQLDSLFRSWYTAYRVLSTANSYKIPDESQRLYSAVFRSQISWIELAFLLVDQSGLPSNPKWPKACAFSNRYAAFDNLDTTNDLVVGVLEDVARRRHSAAEGPAAALITQAFGPRA